MPAEFGMRGGTPSPFVAPPDPNLPVAGQAVAAAWQRALEGVDYGKPRGSHPMSRRFTWVELLVVIVIIAISLAILMPILNSRREAQRRATCLNNSHQIGLAFQNFASTFGNAFPPSAKITKAADGTQTVGGMSFLVLVGSFMDIGNTVIYFDLGPGRYNADPEDTSNKAVVEAMNTQFSEFICPSGPHRQASSAQPSAGITNYKAMGATTRGSLMMVVDPQATPPYGPAGIHPDGAVFPSTHNLPAANISDGLSNTIFTIETVDEAASRWTVGKEATLVGMPQSSSPTGTTPQAPYSFFVQPGFDHTYGPGSAVARAGLRTFLAYDFRPTGADAGKYEDPGFGQTPPAYGPSSMHPGIVVCGFGDASVQAISKQVDAASLFFLITKNNADPFYAP